MIQHVMFKRLGFKDGFFFYHWLVHRVEVAFTRTLIALRPALARACNTTLCPFMRPCVCVCVCVCMRAGEGGGRERALGFVFGARGCGYIRQEIVRRSLIGPDCMVVAATAHECLF